MYLVLDYGHMIDARVYGYLFLDMVCFYSTSHFTTLSRSEEIYVMQPF